MPLFRQKLLKNVKPGVSREALGALGGPRSASGVPRAPQWSALGVPRALQRGLEAPPEHPKELKTQEKTSLKRRKNEIKDTGKTSLNTPEKRA